MANIIILGGGFGGVIAAERLAKTLGPSAFMKNIGNNNTRDERFAWSRLDS